MTNHRHTVGLAAGTMAALTAIALFCTMLACGVFIATRCPADPCPVDAVTIRHAPALPGGDVYRPTDASKAAALEATYGAVNTAALEEVKEGIFGRIRARREARRSAPSSARSAPACVPCQPRPTFAARPAYVPQPASTVIWSHTAPRPAATPAQPQPRPAAAADAVDPASYLDGTYALERPTPTPTPDPFPNLDNLFGPPPECPDGRCPFAR